MPLYDTQCQACAQIEPIWRKIEDRDNLPKIGCCAFESRMRLPPMPPALGFFTEYVSPATGKIIRDERSRRYDLESTGHIPNEPGLDKDIKRWKAENDAKTFAPIEKAVDETVRNLVNTGKIESV